MDTAGLSQNENYTKTACLETEKTVKIRNSYWIFTVFVNPYFRKFYLAIQENHCFNT